MTTTTTTTVREDDASQHVEDTPLFTVSATIA